MRRISLIFAVFIFINIFDISLQVNKNRTKRTKDKCYILALEGGGDKGAYQIGALKGLVDNLPSEEVMWDVITGVSIGSLNAVGISIFSPGDEKAAVDFVLNNWKSIKGKGDIYKNWLLGPLEGLFYKSGLYDVSPSRKLLQKIIAQNDIKRKFVCGATNFMTGEFETWDEETLYRAEYENAILSSGAYPVIFELNSFRNNLYMDGGVKVSIDISSGINKCLDMGFEEDKIVVDIILLNSKVLPQLDDAHIHPLGVLMRVFEIYGYDNAMRDLEYTQEAFPHANYRYIIYPTMKLPSGSIPLTFSPNEIETMIQYGIEDAKRVIKMGSGKSFEKLKKTYREERKGRYGKSSKNISDTNTSEIRNGDEIIFLK